MLFDYDLIVPKKTASTEAVTRRVKLTRGKLVEIRVIFPPGPATLVYATVRHELHQLLPANPEGSLNFDDTMITTRMEYEILDPPYELIISGWSPDTIYPHTITFQFDLIPTGTDTWQEFMRSLFSLQ